MGRRTSRADLDPFQGTTSETLGSGPNPAWKPPCSRSARKVHRKALQGTICHGMKWPFESMVSRVSEAAPWKFAKSALEAPLAQKHDSPESAPEQQQVVWMHPSQGLVVPGQQQVAWMHPSQGLVAPRQQQVAKVHPSQGLAAPGQQQRFGPPPRGRL